MSMTERGHRYLLSCKNNLSKYVIGITLIDQTVNEVATQLVEKIISMFGISTMIVTDQGSNFMSELFTRICKLFQIDKINTVAYHSESNGAFERAHQTLIT